MNKTLAVLEVLGRDARGARSSPTELAAAASEDTDGTEPAEDDSDAQESADDDGALK